MALYRLLAPHYINGRFLEASEIISMPGWIPTIDVEPLDSAAATAYFNAGPRLGQVIRTRWQQFPVPKPVTYWQRAGATSWSLTGLGAGLGTTEQELGGVGRVEDK